MPAYSLSKESGGPDTKLDFLTNILALSFPSKRTRTCHPTNDPLSFGMLISLRHIGHLGEAGIARPQEEQFGVGVDEHYRLAERANDSTWKGNVANESVRFFRTSHGYPSQHKKGHGQKSRRERQT